MNFVMPAVCAVVFCIFLVPLPYTGALDNGKFNSKTCGSRNVVTRFTRNIMDFEIMIVNGRDAKVGAWPWQVGLVMVNDTMTADQLINQETFCGGTLINSRTVVTAAHCFRNNPLLGKNVSVRIGDVTIGTKEVGQEVIKVQRIIKHNHYKKGRKEHDIALLILEKDIKLEKKKTVGTVCLPNNGDPVNATTCFVTGWGVTKEKGVRQAKVLQQAKIRVISNSDCKKAFRKARKNIRIKAGMLCAGKGEKDACKGDSGGPLVCKQHNGRFVLRGIVSFGAGCGRKGLYGVYTKVAYYMKWIKMVLQSK